MDDLRVQEPGPHFCHFPLRDDYGAEFFTKLLSEVEVYDEKSRTNPLKWVKIPGRERNEALDCRNYALAAAHALHPDYDALERRLKGTDQTTRQAPVQAYTAPPPRRRNAADQYDEW